MFPRNYVRHRRETFTAKNETYTMKRSRISVIFWLPVITLACILLLLIAGIPLGIPMNAVEIFGEPADTLNIFDEIYLSGLLLFRKNELTSPVNQYGDDISFQVTLGESLNAVSLRLRDDGLINNPGAFRNYLVYSGLDTSLQAGDYILNPSMTPIEIAWALQDSTPTQINFTILAGWRAEEIAYALSISGLEFREEDFLNQVDEFNADGYLLPGTYLLPRKTSAEFTVRTFLNTFNANLTTEIKNGINQQGLTKLEAITLASIVQKEAIVADEMPLIASVFLNRLNIGMKLDADPTVQYALGFNHSQGTWWTNPLSLSDLSFDSPFNTYLYVGLPPGPICNPSMDAIRAVAFPAQTPYYYFRAACDNSGLHLFAETIEEQVENACP